MSIFASFEIGRKALRVQHKGMEVSGQNVANANTPGYSRQRTEMEAVVPPIIAGHDMAPGRGVLVQDVVRVHSQFYHAQIIATTSQERFWETRRETYLAAEAIFMEPDLHGIGSYLNDFFDTWQEMSSSPEDSAVRAALREKSISLTRTVEDVYMRMEDTRLELAGELERRVNEVNRLCEAIAELNDKIRYVHALDQKSNELLDKLDLAVEELSELLDINVYYKANGAAEIFSGGRVLVQEERPFPLIFHQDEDTGRFEVLSHRLRPLNLEGGRVYGLLEAVNKDLPGLQGELNLMVRTLVEEVNIIHRSSFALDSDLDGLNFFRPIDEDSVAALSFVLSAEIFSDLANIAASNRSFEPGNGAAALDIARLRDRRLDVLNNASVTEYYRSVITAMGAEAQDAERMEEAFSVTRSQFVELHRSISGVNMDEEMLSMSQFQHAWHAAARYLSYVDQMLTVLFTELGR